MRYQAGIVFVLLFTALTQGCGRPAYHIVRPGETLYSISWRYDQDYHDLATWNTLEPPYTLRPGQSVSLSPIRRPSLPVAAPESDSNAMALPPPPPHIGAGSATAVKQTARPSVRTAPPVVNIRPQWLWPVKGHLVHCFVRGAEGIAGRGVDVAGRGGEVKRSAASCEVVERGCGVPSYVNLQHIEHN